MKVAVLFLCIILLVVFLSRRLYKRGIVSETIARKILHIVAISISAASPYFIAHHMLLIIVGLAVPILFLLVKYGFFIDADQGRKSWGIFYFAAAFLVLLLLFPKRPELIFFPMLVLALADGFATIVGSLFGKHTFTISAETKSWEGSIAFFSFSIISFQVLPMLFSFVEPAFKSVSALIIVSVFLTLVEALSVKGRDNIWVPFAVAYWVLLDTTFFNPFSVAIVVIIAAMVFFTYKKRWLTSGGAVATFLLGCLLLISPNPKWIFPALFFFVVGSLISFLPKKKQKQSHGGRTAYQVFFNGGISTVFICGYFLTAQEMFLIGGLAALASSMSDTSSSEIGSRYGTKTYSILTGKKVNPGLSGGISFIGLGAGLFFTTVFSLIAILLMSDFSWSYFLILVISGMAGNVLDSILGAILQVKYRADISSQWSDFPTNSSTQEMKGFALITNDTVNLLNTIFAAFLGLFLYNLL